MVHLLVSSLLSLFVSAYFVLAIEEDPLSLSNLFQVSTASREAGNCAAYLTKLELFLEETKVLAQAMNDAADNYQDDIVAQKLLSSYFGIEYDYDVGEIADGSLSAWKSFRCVYTLIYTSKSWERKKANVNIRSYHNSVEFFFDDWEL